MIPYRDENETLRAPVVTVAVIAVNALVWLVIQGAGMPAPLARSVCRLGLIAGELTGSVPAGTRFAVGPDFFCETGPGPAVEHLFTSMFLHGSWMHLIGKMWFLWIFGNNVEDSMGRLRFVVFYLVSGLAAATLQVAITPASAVPMVGASGAISGVMGAYLVLYPRVRVWTIVPLGFFLTSIALPAWTMLLYWMLLQFLGGFGTIANGGEGGVAFWAHMGGFAAGAALIKLFAKRELIEAHRAKQWSPRRVGWER